MPNGDEKTFEDLEKFLKPRADAAVAGDRCNQTAKEIFDEITEELEKGGTN